MWLSVCLSVQHWDALDFGLPRDLQYDQAKLHSGVS